MTPATGAAPRPRPRRRATKRLAPTPERDRLRISTRSAVLAVTLLGATLALLRVLAASQRVLGWMLAAAALAGLLHPVVRQLERRVPRGLAVGVVAALALFVGVGTTVGIVNGVVRETSRLQEALPREAAKIERTGRLAESAREFDLEARTRRFVDEVPQRLRGGTPADALRSAATRGVAFLATGVLTLFFLLHGPRLARGARGQLPAARRDRVAEVAVIAYRRSFGYAAGTLLMAAAAGLLAWSLALALHLPGAAPLALWVALLDVVPLLGVVVGGLPIILLASVESPGRGLAVALVLVSYQLLEALFLQRRVESRTIRIGPFLTVVAGLVGVEIYGIGGALLVPLAMVVTAAVVAEVWPPEGSAPEEAAP